jgi:hypothetical protein
MVPVSQRIFENGKGKGEARPRNILPVKKSCGIQLGYQPAKFELYLPAWADFGEQCW